MSSTAVQPNLSPVVPAKEGVISTNYTPNMVLPVHRWFRYSAGYSAAWVEQVVLERTHDAPLRVLDPFAGSATTLLACQATGASSIGLEMHPLVARIARAKLAWRESAKEMEERLALVLAGARPIEWRDPPSLMAKIYSPATLAELCGLRDTIAQCATGTPVDELLWLALVAILRRCSPVGTAPWQYVLPGKVKKRVAEPSAALAAQVAMMADDMRAMEIGICPDAPAKLLEQDARDPVDVPEGWADLVVTSPPYPNNYDYADSTRIEMTFLGEIVGWGDLQGAVRTRLVRSCSQHMAGFDAEPILASDDLAPIAGELETVYRSLAIERELHGGKKNYHSMVVAYFADLSKTWQALRRACAPGAEALFVVGDSAPYGVHVPVDRWLGELALAAGFGTFEFTKVRDRNLKWKNRKHRVPLQEGILRVGG